MSLKHHYRYLINVVTVSEGVKRSSARSTLESKKMSGGEYVLSMGALKAVWLQYGSSLWSLAAFLRMVGRESSHFSHTHRCQCRGSMGRVWQKSRALMTFA